MRNLLAALIPALLAGAPLFAQDPPAAEPEEPAGPLPAGEIEIPDPGTPIADPSVARQEVARFKKQMKEARDDEARQAELLRALGAWDHDRILREATRHLRDRSYQVSVAAVTAVARQGGSAEKAGRTLYTVLRRDDRTDVVCAALVGMGKLGYDRRGLFDDVEKLFRNGTGEVKKAAARYFGYVKAKEAFRAIAENLDEPRPTLPPDDPRNPPASYWKAKWEEWDSNRPWYRWALAEIVPGETFETTAEAKQWAESEAAEEHGIEWD